MWELLSGAGMLLRPGASPPGVWAVWGRGQAAWGPGDALSDPWAPHHPGRALAAGPSVRRVLSYERGLGNCSGITGVGRGWPPVLGAPCIPLPPPVSPHHPPQVPLPRVVPVSWSGSHGVGRVPDRGLGPPTPTIAEASPCSPGAGSGAARSGGCAGVGEKARCHGTRGDRRGRQEAGGWMEVPWHQLR